MERQKHWQWPLILLVLALTLYNIVPTLIYYAKPLGRPLKASDGVAAIEEMALRLSSLEEDGVQWLKSYCKLLNIKPTSVSLDQNNPQRFQVQFVKAEDAALLRKQLARAGSHIPFVPAQMIPLAESELKSVSVLRNISVPSKALAQYLSFSEKSSDGKSLAPLYVETVRDRAARVASLAAGPSECAELLRATKNYPVGQVPEGILLELAAKINGSSKQFKSLYVSMTAGSLSPAADIEALLSSMDALRDHLKVQRASLQKIDESHAVRLIETKEAALSLAQQTLKQDRALFLQAPKLLTYDQAFQSLDSSIPLDASPFFSELSIDWSSSEIILHLRPELCDQRDKIDPFLINEIARIARGSNETFVSGNERLTIPVHELEGTSSFLVLNLDAMVKDQARSMLSLLKEEWRPKHPDLLPENFPIVDAAGYAALSEREKRLCLCVFSPDAMSPLPQELTHRSSLYVFIRGFDRIRQEAQGSSSATSALLQSDVSALSSLIQRCGFSGYSLPTYSGDYLFEQPEPFKYVLAALREEFKVKGSERFAVLEFSDLQQRLLVQNRIDTQIHDELLKWQDEYNAAQALPDPSMRYDVPKPTKSPFWSNLTLSFKKYFRGDERKVLRWGLDLSGGKTVQIELRDSNNRAVTDEIDLKQGINELYNRVNKMGVSEVAIRKLGSNIVLDFPGSQALSASELVKASSMYFHIVNEKFSQYNPQLAEISNRFLQGVWNEALVKGQTDPESINAIAWKHLYGDSLDPSQPRFESDAARILYEEGLRLQHPDAPISSNALDNTFSKVTLFRMEEGSLQKQGHPLLLVFANYALEGSSLTNVRASYDPSKGNFLGFDIARNGQGSLFEWTSRFSQEKVAGTELEGFTRGAGWRMAVILNQSVISAPTLNASLKESAMISGSFSQREVNKLASDLKAGSLTFTPHILSEKNVSPELGKTDRVKGIAATIAALVSVIAAMVLYYRFSGVVASIAVLFNLLILWATLQNLQATLSLAGIAGIILTVGMAVDANVLVFERIKEELGMGKKLRFAISSGYQKAFSAILDSNVTTIIAALILLNFDAGPIKGFAITLIIGIASSMFTALFVTRTYFSAWASKTAAKTLSMANWIQSSTFDFLARSKAAILCSLAVIAIGGILLTAYRTTLFGMDFTGGYAIELEVENASEPASAVSHALQQAGASHRDFQIRSLYPESRLRVLFSTAMEQPGRPFYDPSGNHTQIAWIVNALESQSIQLTKESLVHLETSWVAISGQMSDSMRNNALFGLALAFGCIFIYLTVRFEAAYAASAIFCLLHDVAITLGVIGILHAFGVPIQIDLNTIAALMTIIGYSLNDTIIIFDRIREDVAQMRNKPLSQIINHSLNATLSRTSITSGTTLLVLLALVVLGGTSMFSFSLVMTIGVIFGTLSSWFIATPLLLALQRRESRKVTVTTIDRAP